MTGLLEVVVGILLIFLVFSIVVSGMLEWWVQITARRGKYLHLGLSRLLNDNAIFVRVLQHPLVGSLYRDRATRGKPPSYLEPTNFALALASVVRHRGKTTPTVLGTPDVPVAEAAPGTVDSTPLTFAGLRAALVECGAQDSPVAAAVLPIIDKANGNLDIALKGIEEWFNAGMDRVAGWYKAHTQKTLFGIGLLLAILANVDSIEIFQVLNRSPELRKTLGQAAGQVVDSGKIGDVDLVALRSRAPTEEESRAVSAWFLGLGAADQRSRLPIGYDCLDALEELPNVRTETGQITSLPSRQKTLWQRCANEAVHTWSSRSISDLLLKLLGCVITALAAVIGAPYWFDLLAKVVNVRGSGIKPQPSPK
jgi:hypothetical protein